MCRLPRLHFALSAALLSLCGTALGGPLSSSEIQYYGYDAAIELRNEHVRVVLCPQVGGRVLEYSLNGTNILFVSEQEKQWKPGDPPHSSAGRFDIGPEFLIPRRDVLWNGAWQSEITGPGSARLTSQKDPATGVQLIRDFTLDPETTRLSCTQTILNVSDEVKEWCHWSRTFVEGKGLCLIPTTQPSRFPNSYVMYEEGRIINAEPSDPAIQHRDGYLQIAPTPRKPKLGFDSYAGLILYAAPNDLLFLKRFKTYPDRVYNEAAGLTISVWYPDREMVELEPIGPRERLQPGQQASFTEEWWLARMEFPATGSELDIKAVESLAKTLKSVQHQSD